MPTDDEARRNAIRLELSRIEESATYAAQTQLEQSKRWSRANLWLGVSSSVLAAVAGTLALAGDAESEKIAGILALVAAVLAVVLTSLNASARTTACAAAGNAYLAIQNDARQSRLVDLDHEPVDVMRNKLSELTARRDEQNKAAEVASNRAYQLGRRNIIRGGQTYSVDAIDGPQR